MTNITINLKNCGCCGDGSSGGNSGTGYQEPPFNELGDPGSSSGPPEGYSDPGLTIADRQCKMAVWLYGWIDWWIDYLANETIGGHILTTIRTVTAVDGTVGTALKGLISLAVGAAVSQTITPGLTLDDPVVVIAISYFSFTFLSGFESINTKIVTQPLLQDALPKVQAAQSDIVCTLSKASNATEARNNLSKNLDDLDISDEQHQIILSLMPNFLFTMLFFSADWWPSFDDDALSAITATCCGDYTDGDPVTPGSLQHCQASYYVIDMLALAFSETSTAFGLWWPDINPFDNDKPYIRQWLLDNLDIPDKVRDRAADYNSFIWSVGEIVYNATWGLNGGIAADPGFEALSDYITTNRATLVALVQAEADVNDAYDALKADLDTWIDANVGASYTDDFKQAVDALIQPVNPPYLLDLLYTQDSDLLLYAQADCPACEHTVTAGTLDSDDGSTMTVSSVSGSIDIAFDWNGVDNCGGSVAVSNFSVISGSVTPPGGINEAYRLYSVPPTVDSDGDVYNSNSAPGAGPYNNVIWMIINSTTEFTIQFDYTEV